MGVDFPNPWKKPLLRNGRVMMRPSAPKPCGWPAKAAPRRPPLAARALNIDAKQLYAWQKAAQPPLPADPIEAAEVRTLRAANKRLAQELDILKKAIVLFSHPSTP